MKDFGPLQYFLGVEVLKSATGLHLSQTRYTQDLLNDLNMENCKGVPTPMTHSSVTAKDTQLADEKLYRKAIGKLHYLSLTRPDIGFVVGKLSQFMHKLMITHWTTFKRVLRYLKNTSSYGLSISNNKDYKIRGYSDADWTRDPIDKTSTTGYIIFLGNNPISWSSKKQRSMFRSSTKVEYQAVAATVAEINLNWITNLLRELHINLQTPPTVFCDISTTYVCANPVFHSKMKHVAIDFHFVRDQVEHNKLQVNHLHATN